MENLKIRQRCITKYFCDLAGMAEGKGATGIQLGGIAKEKAAGGLPKHDGAHGDLVFRHIG